MATVSMRMRKDTVMYATILVCLILSITPVSAYSPTKTDLKRSQSHTQSQSYFDEISRVGRLSQQQKYFESANILRELDKLSETLLSLSGVFSNQLQKTSAANFVGSNDGGDVQEIFLSALDAVAASNGSSSTCTNDTAQFLINIFQKEPYAIQFLDSFGKPGPGLLLGRLNFVGNYNQCRAASGLADNSTRRFHGNYCTIKANIGPPASFGQLMVQLGSCMPDTCSEDEITLYVTEVIHRLGLNGTLGTVTTECHTGDREMTAATVVAIVLVVIIGLMMIFGTSFDIIFIQWPKWKASSAKEDSFLTNGQATHHHGYTAIGEVDLGPKDESTPLIGIIKPDQNSICTKILLAFSIYTNGSKVLDTSQPSGSLSAIHGIRFLSMSWVLLGHLFVFGLAQVGNLGSVFPVLMSRWTFDAIANAFVSVDTFFTLSGLLTAYLALTEMKKKGWRLNWPLFYFHRFWRLTPPYMLTILVVLGFQQYLGSGALWPSVQPADKANCEKSWWTNMLYINNLVNFDTMCFGHSWYLANDMQFFWLSPLMIVPFYFHFSIGVASCMGFLLITWITTGVLSTQNEWPSTLMQGLGGGGMNLNTWFQDYYTKPWCRIGAYVVGVLAGSYLAKYNGQIRMKWYAAWIGWICVVAIGLATVYGLRGDIGGGSPSSVGVNAFYNAVARSAWGICVCWVIIACASGHGGFVNSILSWSPFVVMGRLTYMVYLIHPCLLYVYFQNQETLYYITDTSIAVTFCGVVVLTNMIAFVLMLAFESPWIGLERTFLRKKQKE